MEPSAGALQDCGSASAGPCLLLKGFWGWDPRRRGFISGPTPKCSWDWSTCHQISAVQILRVSVCASDVTSNRDSQIQICSGFILCITSLLQMMFVSKLICGGVGLKVRKHHNVRVCPFNSKTPVCSSFLTPNTSGAWSIVSLHPQLSVSPAQSLNIHLPSF